MASKLPLKFIHPRTGPLPPSLLRPQAPASLNMSFPSSSANPQHSLQGINTDINQTSISIGSNDYTAALDSIRQNLSRVQSVLDAGQTTDDIAEKASSRLAL